MRDDLWAWFPRIKRERVLNCIGRSSVQMEYMSNSDHPRGSNKLSFMPHSLPILQTHSHQVLASTSGNNNKSFKSIKATANKAKANWQFQARIGVPTNSVSSRSSQPHLPIFHGCNLHRIFPIDQSLQVALAVGPSLLLTSDCTKASESALSLYAKTHQPIS